MTEPFGQAFWGLRFEVIAIGGDKFKWFARATLLCMMKLAKLRYSGVLPGPSACASSDQRTTKPESPHHGCCGVQGPTPVSSLWSFPLTSQRLCTRSATNSHRADVAEAIKRAAAKAGQDPRGFSSHSLRSCEATHMYRAGTDGLTIPFHSRLLYDVFKIYTRVCKESVATLSSDMVTGSREDSALL
ncbi:LOW QUALITY PROTEIN: hypothetical protein PHMEG_00017532 [Phytophthora megakarya]|uniref:Tyr recombinase domain-containing protein n=1 Tax=Phytophthora megakarya TaxID=4795 RepID=A0A225VWL0_9STRA|nr:LOW QUALITY PROTEIN: hypothetical protein PHMEG_00017532 [Phytophthora megakarya]